MEAIQSIPGGWAGWLIEAFARVRSRMARSYPAEPAMQLVETISLGGRRQLSLVRCGTQQFLIGCGADQVQTIVLVPRVADGEVSR